MAALDGLYAEVSGATVIWAELYNLLKRGQYDTSGTRAAIDSASVDQLNTRTVFALELLGGLRPSNDTDLTSTLLFPRSNEIQGSIRTIRKHTQAIVNQVKPHLQDGGTIKDANGNFSLSVTRDNKQIAGYEATPNFNAINQAVNQVIPIILPIAALSQTPGGRELLDKTEVLAKFINNANEALIEIQSLSATVKKHASDIDAAIKNIQERAASIEAVHNKMTATQQQMEKEAASVSAQVEKIKAVGTSADALEKQVTGYAAGFEAFQKQLDERNRLFNEFVKNTDAASEKNRIRDSEIDRLTEKADSMIRGATTAGLSKSLDDARSAYEKRMSGARLGFLISITVLVISALPLAADLMPGLFGSYLSKKLGAGDDPTIPFIAKIFLLFPGTWLTLFFAKSYSEFFHLEREYAHKAALAKSIEGFKREAPSFAEAITSSVFAEILNNPSSRPSPEPAQHPLYDALVNKLPEILGSKKKQT